jgi:hypothetical protein
MNSEIRRHAIEIPIRHVEFLLSLQEGIRDKLMRNGTRRGGCGRGLWVRWGVEAACQAVNADGAGFIDADKIGNFGVDVFI